MHQCSSYHSWYHSRSFEQQTSGDQWKECTLRLLQHWMFGCWGLHLLSMILQCLRQLHKLIFTTSHTTINFDEFTIFVERHSWTLLATSYQSAQHNTICTHRQGFAHVTWVLVSSVRDERDVIVRANWGCIHECWELWYSTSCNYSGNTNAAISDSTSNTVSSASDEILSSFSCGDWSWNNINSWEFLFQLLSSIHCQFRVPVGNIDHQNIAAWLNQSCWSFDVIFVGTDSSTHEKSSTMVFVGVIHWLILF